MEAKAAKKNVTVTNILRKRAIERVRPQPILSPRIPVGISRMPAINKCKNEEIRTPEAPNPENMASTAVQRIFEERAVPLKRPSVTPNR